VLVGSQVSGRLLEIHVNYNSTVKKGMVLAKLDPQLFQANLAQARANLTAAQGQLQKAQAQSDNAAKQYERSKELADRKLIAQADLDTAEATMRAAKADVAAARGQLEQARAAEQQSQVNLGYTTIVSPVDGIVISRSVDVGQTVAASLQAPTLFTIAEDLKKMQVDTNVAEADVGKLSPGMAATFTVDAYPGEQFQGTVRQIRNAPQTVQNVVTYDAVIDVDNSALKLKPGMTANVTFIYAERTDVIAVPNAALRFRPPAEVLASASAARAASSGEHHGGAGRPGGGKGKDKDPNAPQVKFVWVRRGADIQRVRIKTGLTDGSVTEVVEGDLKVGDEVVLDATGGTDAPAAPAQGGRPPMGRIL
jgi:HlyD family secretion protein